MRLIILNQFFYPDHSATSQLMTVLAEDLTRNGVSVTALASRGSYSGDSRYTKNEDYKGVKIRRIWATNFGKHQTWRRLTDYITFYIGTIWKLLSIERHDILMALTTPPLIGFIALLIARIRGMRFVSLQEDLYPNLGIALGFIPSKGLFPWCLKKISNFVLLNSDRVILLSQCMRDQLISNLRKADVKQFLDHVDIIHNWADGEEVQPLTGVKDQFWVDTGLPELANKFVLLFTGNWGLVNDFSPLIKAAQALHNEKHIAFVFIGGGARGQELDSAINDLGLKNIYKLPYQPRALMPYALSASDALLITLREGLAGMSVPSKTYTSMAAGRPLLFVGDPKSDTAKIINQADCGFACEPQDVASLTQTIRSWATQPNLTKLAGARGRAYFEANFDRPKAVLNYLNSLQRSLAPNEAYTVTPQYADQSVRNTLPTFVPNMSAKPETVIPNTKITSGLKETI